MKTIWDYPRYVIGVVAGWSVNPKTHFIRVEKTVSIRSNVPLPVQADGDIIGTTPVDVVVLPGALTVLIPKKPVIVSEEGVHLPPVGLHPIAETRSIA
jgi:diacylglycerol kinase family enzyme